MPKTISANELKKKIDQGFHIKIVDALTPDSYNKCHIPGAINIPLNQVEAKALQKLSTKDDIVVYCGSRECDISTQASTKLEKLGFKNVWEFEGGLKEWQGLKYPCHGQQTASSNPEAQRMQGGKQQFGQQSKFKKAA
ncbi:MAG: hypothetical protein A3F16_02845 [Deltaproteobacteria bacterium RIFCSPHIGHO2_12_FULL_43_9]|nr:MAG: hypothetical protein A3F16_02845 [Deltaproteobacteria bacterium RIFCSPHIGHO2_12_FULL_43_9]